MADKQFKSRHWSRLAFLGLLVLLLTLIINFPARLAANWLFSSENLPADWQRIEGTIFKSSIYGLTLTLESGHKIFIDQLNIRTAIFPLVTGKISSFITVSIDNHTFTLNSGLRLNGWQFNDLKGEITFDDLKDLFPELEILGLSGTMQIHSGVLAGNYHELPNQGDFNLVIKDLSTNMVPTERALGSYQISTDEIIDDVISANIFNLRAENQLLIQSRLSVDKKNNQISVSGYAWLSNSADQSLGELLLLLGELENNRAIINWTARINNR